MIEPGVYKHFKGDMYRVLFVALSAESSEEHVVYVSLKNGSIWTRTWREFNEPVAWPDGTLQKRFMLVEHAP